MSNQTLRSLMAKETKDMVERAKERQEKREIKPDQG